MLALSRARFAVLAVSVLALAAGCLPLNGQENHLFTSTNRLRADHGMRQLVQHDDLVRDARAWAQTLATRGKLSHSDLGSLSVGWTAAAENVGRSSSIEDVAARLEASPSHRENMLNPGYVLTGVGTARAKDGTVYAVQLFVRP